MMQPPLPTRNPIVPQPATPQPQPSAGWDMNAPVSAFYGQPQDAWAQGRFNVPANASDTQRLANNTSYIASANGLMPSHVRRGMIEALEKGFVPADVQGGGVGELVNKDRVGEMVNHFMEDGTKSALAVAGTQSPGTYLFAPNLYGQLDTDPGFLGIHFPRHPKEVEKEMPFTETNVVFDRDVNKMNPGQTLFHEANHSAVSRMFENDKFKQALTDILGGSIRGRNQHERIDPITDAFMGEIAAKPADRQYDREQFMADSSVALNPHPALKRDETGTWSLDPKVMEQRRMERFWDDDTKSTLAAAQYERDVLLEQLAQQYLAQTKPRGPR